jgi:alpha-1,2-mannosyltransferase
MRAAETARSMGRLNTRFRELMKDLPAEQRPALALFVFVLVLCVLSALEVVFHDNDGDFLSFYAAARAATADVDFYDQAQLERFVARHGWGERVYPYLYPPFLAHALRPLATLELATAHRLWLGANVVAFAASVSLVLLSARAAWRAVTPRRRPGYWLLLTLAAVLVWALPLRNNLLLGQVNPLVLLFISLAVRAHLLGRNAPAGFWLAPAIMIKLTPAVLLLFFLLRRNHRALLTCTVCLVLMAAVSLGLGAGPDWLSFVSHAPERTYGTTIPGLFPAATVWNFAPAGWLARLLPEHEAWVPRLSLLMFAAACLVTVWLAGRARSPANDCLALASLFPVLLLASPLTYLHHVVYVMPALVIWLLRAWSEGRHALFAATLLAAFIVGTDWAPLYDRLFGASASPLLTSINLYAVLALLAIGWRLWSHGLRSATPSEHVQELTSPGMPAADGLLRPRRR